jgi:hypothetical protein
MQPVSQNKEHTMTDSESLLDTLRCIETKANGELYISVLNTIANLMRETNNRKSKARYARDFNLGKLQINLFFDGMK